MERGIRSGPVRHRSHAVQALVAEREPHEPAPPYPAVHSVPIGSLLPADSPRLEGEDRDHILRLMETEEPLPPILVHRASSRVIDGMHRLHATMLQGGKDIDVVYFDGTEAEAFVKAVEANITHGLPLSRADRKAAAARIMEAYPQLSDRSVAARTGLSAKSIAGIRRSSAYVPQSNGRVGADGRTRPLNGAEGRLLVAEALADRPDASLREIARTAGVSVSTAHDVRKRLAMHRSPVPDKYSANPSRRPPSAAPGPVHPVRRGQGLDLGLTLQKLMKDPSLRHTDPGRELLRLLQALAATAKDRTELLDSVPAHCSGVVAELARAYAVSWCQFAEELERR